MVKRKLKTSEPARNVVSKINDVKTVPNEKMKEKLVPFDFDDQDCDVIIEVKDKEVYLPFTFLKMASKENVLRPFTGGRLYLDVSSKSLVEALSFYVPKISKGDTVDFTNLEEAVRVAKFLNLKRLQDYIEKVCLRKAFYHPRVLDEKGINALRIAQTYDMFLFLEQRCISESWLKHFGLIANHDFLVLSNDMRYELLKNTVIRQLVTYAKHVYERKFFRETVVGMEIQMIFNFLDLEVYENRMVDLAPKKNPIFMPKNYYLTSLEKFVDLESISCNKESADCVTLVVEEREIHVNSFLLTNNSPVFKAMLSSNSFKEGQSKRIELPGKNFNQIIYLLQHLYSSKHIGNIYRVRDLSLLCREYQIDWLTEKIKTFIIEEGSKNTADEILQYLTLSEEANFGLPLYETLVNQLHDSFQTIQLCPNFMSLSRTMQIVIARKRLWFLLENFGSSLKNLCLNRVAYGFLSIFKEQPVFNFEYNEIEQSYLRRCHKDGKSNEKS